MIASLNRLAVPRAASAVNWLLVVVCLLLAARIGVVLVDGVDVAYQPLSLSPSSERVGTLPPTDWRLFGEPLEPEYGFAQPLPPTPLSLRLRGVVTGERGYAIIVDAEGNEGVYRAGDMVPGDAEVVTIEPRRVVLERNAVREALELPGSATSTAAAPRARDPARPRDGLASGVGIGSLASMTSGLRLDPNELAQRITILPVAGGGFRVRAGRDAAIFTQLGFHANDIVLAINGQPVDNQADVRAVFESFSPGEPLAITVRRGERQLVLTPDLSMLGEAGQR